MDDELLRIPLKIDDLPVRREIVLALPTDQASVFVVRNIPAFATGVAFGDRIEITDSDAGEYVVLERMGQVTIRAFIDGSLEREEIERLISETLSLGGVFEVARNGKDDGATSLLLISLDVSVGFPKIEEVMQKFEGLGGQWEYGNIYDDEGAPLAWW